MIQEGLPGLPAEVLQAAIWWVHAIASAAWVGGALVYLLVIRPALRATPPGPALEGALAARFQDVVEVSAVALAVSGVVLTLGRLASGAAGPAYVALLGVKVALALAMFAIATELRWAGRARSRGRVPGRAGGRGALSRVSLGLGMMVVLLAIVLRRLFEAGLGG